MIKLIGIHGKIGMGKDTVARTLAVMFNAQTGKKCARYMFAQLLKESAELVYNIKMMPFKDDEKVFHTSIGHPRDFTHEQKDEFYGQSITVGKYLQDYGKFLRDNVSATIHANRVIRNVHNDFLLLEEIIDTKNPFLLGLITDLRYPNEKEILHKHNGITIKIKGKPYKKSKRNNLHESETALDAITDFDYIIDNQKELIPQLQIIIDEYVKKEIV